MTRKTTKFCRLTEKGYVCHSSGCLPACRDAHLPVGEGDHGIGLALCLALSRCQGSCGIIPNGPVSSYSKSFNRRQGLKCQHLDTDYKTMTKF